MHLESCQDLWQFDEARLRFRRAPKDVGLLDPPLEHEWDAYTTLEIDAGSDAFAVVLNGDRTRVLRSRVHTDPCRWCTDEPAPAVAESR